MALDLQQELRQAHALLNQFPPAKLSAVRTLLEVMIDGGDEELTQGEVVDAGQWPLTIPKM